MLFDRAGLPFVGVAWLIALVAALYVGWAFAVPGNQATASTTTAHPMVFERRQRAMESVSP